MSRSQPAKDTISRTAGRLPGISPLTSERLDQRCWCSTHLVLEEPLAAASPGRAPGWERWHKQHGAQGLGCGSSAAQPAASFASGGWIRSVLPTYFALSKMPFTSCSLLREKSALARRLGCPRRVLGCGAAPSSPCRAPLAHTRG